MKQLQVRKDHYKYKEDKKLKMEMYLNKKNLNRISRKSATLIQFSPSVKSPYSTISTFRQMKQTKHVIQNGQDKKPQISIKLENKSFYTHFENSLKKKIFLNQLSMPKPNFRQQVCKKSKAHDKFYQTARFRLVKQREKVFKMNRTISHTSERKRNMKSLWDQDPIDLQRENFQRRHQTLKHYQKLDEQINQISRNMIMSNRIGKFSTQQIIEIKQRQELQKGFIMALIKTGQALSNEAAQTDQLRQLSTLISKGQSSKQKTQKFQRLQLFTEGVDNPIIQKYSKLLNSIHESQTEFPTDSYQEYDKFLTQKNPSRRTRKINSKVLIHCAQQWR